MADPDEQALLDQRARGAARPKAKRKKVLVLQLYKHCHVDSRRRPGHTVDEMSAPRRPRCSSWRGRAAKGNGSKSVLNGERSR